ncbi:MAG: CBS domain-containing protein [Ketobacteraceae bacterium]|nr:CBS domain-containing protein [Ketobacteraceae bacterium]
MTEAAEAYSTEDRLRHTLAKDLMTQHIMPAYADWSVKDLAEFLVSNGISGAPVVDNDEKLLGVVSLTDVARHASIANDEADVRVAHGYYTDALDYTFDDELANEFGDDIEEQTTVKDIMTPMVHEVPADATVKEAAAAMVRNRIHRVFVSRNQKIVGVLSALDVLRLID